MEQPHNQRKERDILQFVPSLVFSIQSGGGRWGDTLNEKSRIILKSSHDIKSVGEEYY